MASGNTLFSFFPANNVPPSTNYATRAWIAALTGVRDVLVFEGSGGSNDESAIFPEYFPSQYGGGGVNVMVDYSTDGTDVDAVQFEVSIESLQDGDDQTGTADFGTATDITDTPSAMTIDALNRTAAGAISHSNCGSPAVGDRMRLKVTLDHDHSTNSDNIHIHGVYVTET